VPRDPDRRTVAPLTTTWVPVPPGSDFTVANLPYGVSGGRVHVAIGDHALDLARLASEAVLRAPVGWFDGGSLNPFLEAGPAAWAEVREQLAGLLTGPSRPELLVDRLPLPLDVPVAVGDYVDGYGGIHHATHLGRILRPGGEPLLPNYRHLPVAYHGRAGTIVPSGTGIRRPSGQVPDADGTSRLVPTAMLDLELELGAVIGVGNEQGRPIRIDRADEHIFGYVLLNDWSARDIQAFEYQPLGPFLAKSFATSISSWVVPAAALQPLRGYGIAAQQEPEPLPYLRTDPSLPALHLTFELASASMRADGLAAMAMAEVELLEALYWTPAQLLTHATVNGASTRPGDLFGSGTLSGPDHRTQAGCLMELSWRGTEAFTLPSGERRTFLEDGDEVTLRGWAGAGDDRVGFGALTGTVLGVDPVG
jgi:fumarylacetoacetase